eukprot:scaffold2361_cov390-Prasinococcus_capsulatus_cf.AAC.3
MCRDSAAKKPADAFTHTPGPAYGRTCQHTLCCTAWVTHTKTYPLSIYMYLGGDFSQTDALEKDHLRTRVRVRPWADASNAVFTGCCFSLAIHGAQSQSSYGHNMASGTRNTVLLLSAQQVTHAQSTSQEHQEIKQATKHAIILA